MLERRVAFTRAAVGGYELDHRTIAAGQQSKALDSTGPAVEFAM
jgi:hypothetical protein